VLPSVGRFSLGGFDLFTDFDQARKLIGYSPQHNLVFETMNVDEHIQYYARLKGIPVKFRDKIVEERFSGLGL
jgi:ABC-type multidrug transport system ATPase subunit